MLISCKVSFQYFFVHTKLKSHRPYSFTPYVSNECCIVFSCVINCFLQHDSHCWINHNEFNQSNVVGHFSSSSFSLLQVMLLWIKSFLRMYYWKLNYWIKGYNFPALATCHKWVPRKASQMWAPSSKSAPLTTFLPTLSIVVEVVYFLTGQEVGWGTNFCNI